MAAVRFETPVSMRYALVAGLIVIAHALAFWAAQWPTLSYAIPDPVAPVLTRLIPPQRPPAPTLPAPRPHLVLRVQAPVIPEVPLLRIQLPAVGERSGPVGSAGGAASGSGNIVAAAPTSMSLLWAPSTLDYYPSLAKELHQQGTVVTRICIDAAGQVQSVQLLRSSFFKRLDGAALSMAQQTRWRPATVNRQATAGCEPFYVKFELSDD